MGNPTGLTLNVALIDVAEKLKQADYQPAVLRCDALLSSYPDAVRVLSLRARALQVSGDMARAAQDYARIMEITPTDAFAATGLLQCQIRLGRTVDALATAIQLADYDAGNPDATRIVGVSGGHLGEAGRVSNNKTKFAAGLKNKAISDVRRWVEQAPDRIDLQVVLAEFMWLNGLRIATAELCRRILDSDPDCLSAHGILYTLWTRAGNSGLAADHLASIDRLDPDHRQTVDALGNGSPVAIRDVPAQPAQRLRPVPDDEDDREHAEWMSQLIAGSSLLPLETNGETAHESAAAPAVSNTDVSEEILVAASVASPIDWSAVADESTPAWMNDLGQAVSSDDLNPPAAPVEAVAVGSGVAVPTPEEEHGVGASSTRPDPVLANKTSVPIAAPAAEGMAEIETVVPADVFAPLEWMPAEPTETAETARVTESLKSTPPKPEVVAKMTAKVGKSAQDKSRVSKRTKSKAGKPKQGAEDSLSSARRALEAGDYQQAADCYARLVKAGKRLDDAQIDLDVATRAYPDVVRFHMLLGELYTRKGEVAPALASYRRAMELTN